MVSVTLWTWPFCSCSVSGRLTFFVRAVPDPYNSHFELMHSFLPPQTTSSPVLFLRPWVLWRPWLPSTYSTIRSLVSCPMRFALWPSSTVVFLVVWLPVAKLATLSATLERAALAAQQAPNARPFHCRDATFFRADWNKMLNNECCCFYTRTWLDCEDKRYHKLHNPHTISVFTVN